MFKLEKLRSITISDVILVTIVVMIGWNVLMLIVSGLTATLAPFMDATDSSIRDLARRETTYLAYTILLVFLAVGAKQALKQPGNKPRKFYAVVIGIFVTIGVLMHLFGPRWVQDPLLKDRFDLRTRVPNYMVYELPGHKINLQVRPGYENGNLLHPDHCRPAGVLHEGFNYVESGTCFSEVDRTPLRPIEATDVIVQPTAKSLFSSLSNFWEDDTSDSNANGACEDSRLFRRDYKMIPGERYVVQLSGSRDQKVNMDAGLGLEQRFVLEFTETPLPSAPRFQPRRFEDFIEIHRHGSATGKDAFGLGPGKVRISPKMEGFDRVGNACLSFYAYIR